MLRRCVLSSLLLVLFGCFSMPQTAEEFRQAVPGSFSAKHQVYEVDRSYRQVADTLNSGYTFVVLASDVFILWKWADRMRHLVGALRQPVSHASDRR